jgi:hypothetical protein
MTQSSLRNLVALSVDLIGGTSGMSTLRFSGSVSVRCTKCRRSAAINTANLIAAQMIEPMTTEMFRNIVKALSSYMPGESDEDDEDDLFDPRAMAKLKEREQ